MAAMTSCDPQGFEPDNDGKIKSIAVKEAVYVSSGTPSMQLSLKDNAELQLNVVIMPQNAKNQKLTYTNKYPELLEVTQDGLLKGKGIGTDTLTISSTDGSGVSVRFVVNISDHMVKATAINVTEAGSNILLKIGGNNFNLAECVTLAPADTWNKAVTYTSNDNSIATVDADGIVTPVSVGATTITIKTTDGSDLSKDCAVTVQDLVVRKVDYVRDTWTVSVVTGTGYDYARDGWSATLGEFTTGKPQDMFDSSGGTYLGLVKPGKSYSPGNGADAIPLQPADVLPYFIVDMKSAQEFDYIMWQHRNGANPAGGSNNYNQLRVFGVDIAGSNDGSNFTDIERGVMIPNAAGYVGQVSGADANTYRVDIPASNYRYVKISISMWSDIYTSPEGNGATAGSTMQIAEFGLGYTVIE